MQAKPTLTLKTIPPHILKLKEVLENGSLNDRPDEVVSQKNIRQKLMSPINESKDDNNMAQQNSVPKTGIKNLTSPPSHVHQPSKVSLRRCQRVKDALSFLHQTFPLVFVTQNPKPLQIGIFYEIISHIQKENEKIKVDSHASSSSLSFPSKRSIRQALFIYVNSLSYLQSMQTNEMRFTLLGEPVESIKPEHKMDAEILYNKMVFKK